MMAETAAQGPSFNDLYEFKRSKFVDENTRQIQKTQCAFNFPSNFPSFNTLIIHEGENFAFPKLYSENLAGIKISFAMPTIATIHARCPVLNSGNLQSTRK